MPSREISCAGEALTPIIFETRYNLLHLLLHTKRGGTAADAGYEQRTRQLPPLDFEARAEFRARVGLAVQSALEAALRAKQGLPEYEEEEARRRRSCRSPRHPAPGPGRP